MSTVTCIGCQAYCGIGTMATVCNAGMQTCAGVEQCDKNNDIPARYHGSILCPCICCQVRFALKAIAMRRGAGLKFPYACCDGCRLCVGKHKPLHCNWIVWPVEAVRTVYKVMALPGKKALKKLGCGKYSEFAASLLSTICVCVFVVFAMVISK